MHKVPIESHQDKSQVKVTFGGIKIGIDVEKHTNTNQ